MHTCVGVFIHCIHALYTRACTHTHTHTLTHTHTHTHTHTFTPTHTHIMTYEVGTHPGVVLNTKCNSKRGIEFTVVTYLDKWHHYIIYN